MEKKRNVIQVYAIIVNVVVIITIIISLTGLISAFIDRSAPLYASWDQQDLSSFEKYKLEVLKTTTEESAYIPTDEEIRGMYDSAKQERIDKVMHRTYRDIVVSSVIIGISFVLLAFHWWLIKKYNKPEFTRD